MSKIAIAIHGGASPNYPFIRKAKKDIEKGLKESIQSGYSVLKKGGSALDAVEAAVRGLEDNTVFNAGAGSALNCKGQVEMDAAIMNGKNLKAGAISMVRCIKNPISLARLIMEKTQHVFLSGYGANELAKIYKIEEEPEAYFITPHQLEYFKSLHAKETLKDIIKKETWGTVGAVALDKKGNLAAATSTGGTSNSLPGRIGDSCVIGAGCYANNKTCAVSCTGIGEYLIRGVVAHTVSMLMEFGIDLEKACSEVVFSRKAREEMGLISINKNGDIAIAFNTTIMKRAWIGTDGELNIKIGR